MANAMIATSALVDAATLTSPSALPATLPIANLQDYRLGKVARFTDPTDVIVVADLGAAPDPGITLLGLLGTNLSATATVRWRGAASEAGLTAAPGYDGGTVSAWTSFGQPAGWDVLHSLKFPATPQSFQWWRCDAADPDNASEDGVDIGRLYIDAAWQPSINIQYGAGLGFIDPSIVGLARGGQLLVQPLRRRRAGTFLLDFLREDEMLRNAFELDRLRGVEKDVLLVVDPAATEHLHRYSVYGLLTELKPIVLPKSGVFQKPYSLEELIA